MRSNSANERRGVILLVVLALLTLFAIVGLTFVLYADSEAASARIARDSETAQRADVEPEQALAFFLGQLIYDVADDLTGVGSALRGHSLARTMLGLNYLASPFGGGFQYSSNPPYSGIGRLHYTNTALNVDDYYLPNYTWFPGDGFVRDPERFGVRTNTNLLQGSVQPNPYVAGNAPYTAADFNSMFLAAIKADGTLLSPSYHRSYGPFGSLDPSNPNWYNTTNKALKYMVLRPRPADNPPIGGRPGFPTTEDAGGDVKNLVGAPGGNDSIWLDIGAPVMTTRDGTKYKMLVAPLVLDLDGRINLNAAGNILGPNNGHVSNQGWGPWEANLAKVLYADIGNNPQEYKNLFVGNTLPGNANKIFGRYAPNPMPPPAFTPTDLTIPPPSFPPPPSFGSTPHFYAQADYNGLNEAAPGTPSSRLSLPTGANYFPQFLQGYLNGGPSEITNHPSLYDPSWVPFFNQGNGGAKVRVFSPGDMEPLLRPNSLGQTRVDAGSAALLSDLIRLCPQNFGPSASSPRFRNLVTTLSEDLVVPGVSPYWYTLNGAPPSPYPIQPIANPTAAPISNAVPFPTVRGGQPLPNIAGTIPTGFLSFLFPPSEYGFDINIFGPSWAAASASLPRILLTQASQFSSLPPYPHMGSGGGFTFQPIQAGPISPYGTAYDLSLLPDGFTPNPIATQWGEAQSQRQTLAGNIYQTLLAVTGVLPPANPSAPTPEELVPRRWLAQLAVNIVDYIDEDDICTPYNFYPGPEPYFLPEEQLGATQGGDDNGTDPTAPQTGANPLYWVFGTEMPKVVLNEVLVQTPNADPAAPIVANTPVKVWAELFNTMPAKVSGNAQTQDTYRVPFNVTIPNNGGSYSPYRITICQNLMPSGKAPAPLPDASANVLGKGNVSPNPPSPKPKAPPLPPAPFPASTTDLDFQNGAALIGGGTQAKFTDPVTKGTVNAGVDPQSYLLLGPQTLPAGQFEDPFVAATAKTPGVPGNTPVIRTDSMGYTAEWVQNATTDERTTGVTVLLRRLANPYLPPDPRLVLEMQFFGEVFFQLNPTYNPYVTVDYVQNVPLRSSANPPVAFNSRGKRQPYSALTLLAPPAAKTPANAASLQATSPVTDQIANNAAPPQGAITVNNVTHTFGMPNFPLPQSGRADWLVHLDRQPISPLEVLHVSGYQPYQLTQQFVSGNGDNTVPANMFRHYVPWLDGLPAGANVAAPWWFDPAPAPGKTHRLYRLFDFLECGDRVPGTDFSFGGVKGRVNLNTVWDPEILQALVDANPSIGINVNPPNTPDITTNPNDPVAQIFANMLKLRSPTGAPSLNDRPFLPFGMGLNMPSTQYPKGTSVTTDTFLRFAPPPVGKNQQVLLFQNPTDGTLPAPQYVHPYLQTQLLTKMYNSVTTRSNVFAVWVTVGFFEVIGPQNTLGAEIGRSEGRQIRHRMFAIVNRTNTQSSFFFPPGPLYDPRSDEFSGMVPYYSIID
jgi:hypothetical protein